MGALAKFSIEGKIWRYPGPAGWYFVDLGKKESARIQRFEGAKKVAWGYVCVEARIGKTRWETTLFPSKDGRYLLAIKAAVRKKEQLYAGHRVRVELELK